MKKSEFHNDAIDIVPQKSKDGFATHQLKLKGKKVAEGRCIGDFYEFNSLGFPAEIVLDFDTALLPYPMHYYVHLPGTGYMNMHTMAAIFFENKTCKFEYCFWVRQEQYDIMLINPAQLVLAFCELAEAKGYKTECSTEMGEGGTWAHVNMNFPLKGNMYEYYKAHLNVFDILFAKAETAVRKRIAGQ